MNIAKLRGLKEEKHISQRKMSKEINIKLTTFNLKMNKKSAFTFDDVVKIAKVLNESIIIFLD